MLTVETIGRIRREHFLFARSRLANHTGFFAHSFADEHRAESTLHATPESNAFTLWLGAKLTALGYEVFADILRLRGGNDWERIFEDAVRNKAVKFSSWQRQWPLKNRVFAARSDLRPKPRRKSETQTSLFRFASSLSNQHSGLHARSGRFFEGLGPWANRTARAAGNVHQTVLDRWQRRIWRSIQLKDARAVGPGPETLISNWLAIHALPERSQFYDFKSGISIGAAEKAKQSARIPMVAAVARAIIRDYTRISPCEIDDHQRLAIEFGPY